MNGGNGGRARQTRLRIKVALLIGIALGIFCGSVKLISVALYESIGHELKTR